ncbi:hypothetical protein BDK51DRAFT_43322 [Blyttiomyces helicus]|uniref:Uncharacterized protein n=1 Tax=Blyttiomyces helicus TaxID=388810 RepID=A0A4P9WC72_9FUNG|nr:hypothetical protein BDK51DRAFT_43322 [Blyttiomyces helicus]|eukprot:RKO87946.1 hypothetical protein BDK51DRAFT_43322 [Blyttiomyces helicus]
MNTEVPPHPGPSAPAATHLLDWLWSVAFDNEPDAVPKPRGLEAGSEGYRHEGVTVAGGKRPGLPGAVSVMILGAESSRSELSSGMLGCLGDAPAVYPGGEVLNDVAWSLRLLLQITVARLHGGSDRVSVCMPRLRTPVTPHQRTQDLFVAARPQNSGEFRNQSTASSRAAPARLWPTKYVRPDPNPRELRLVLTESWVWAIFCDLEDNLDVAVGDLGMVLEWDGHILRIEQNAPHLAPLQISLQDHTISPPASPTTVASALQSPPPLLSGMVAFDPLDLQELKTPSLQTEMLMFSALPPELHDIQPAPSPLTDILAFESSSDVYSEPLDQMTSPPIYPDRVLFDSSPSHPPPELLPSDLFALLPDLVCPSLLHPPSELLGFPSQLQLQLAPQLVSDPQTAPFVYNSPQLQFLPVFAAPPALDLQLVTPRTRLPSPTNSSLPSHLDQPSDLSFPPPSSSPPPSPSSGPRPRHLRVPRNLKRLKTVEEATLCNSCHAPIATLLLHGPASAFSTPHVMSLTCCTCDAAAALECSSLLDVAPATKNGTSKKMKRPMGVEGPLFCSACKEHVGVGVMRMLDGERDGEPGFDVEPVCARCWVKYKFCTACGGGGLFRTGRWRPNELFSPNRKLCNLNHDRIGALTFTHEVFSCPEGFPPSLVPTAAAFWGEQFYKRFALPTLEARIRKSVAEVDDCLSAPLPTGLKRYACVARGSPVAKPRRAAAKVAGVALPPLGSTPTRQLVQFRDVEWQIEERIVCIYGSMSKIQTVAIAAACVRKLLDTILAEARALSLLIPQHVTSMVRPPQAEIDREDLDLPHPMNKLGFGRATRYVARRSAERVEAGLPPLDPALFAPERFEISNEDERWVMLMAVGMEELLYTVDDAILRGLQ